MGAIVAPNGTWDASVATWPYPQIRFLKHYTVGLAVEGLQLYLYEMVISGDNWNATFIQDLGAVADIGQVEILDYGMFFALSVYDSVNETVTCYIRQPGIAAGDAGDFELINNTNIPNFITGCDYNGQAVIAGIDSPAGSWTDVYRHSVAWSGVSTFDFRPDEYRTAGYAHTGAGQSGEGIIWKARPLGQSIVLYGSEGIFQMTPITQPVSGWTQPVSLARVPPLHWNTIAGNNRVHYYIDENLDLWRATSEGIEKLSYKEFLQTLNPSDILLVYEEKNGRLYISDGVKSFVLTQQGMYECHQCVTSIGMRRDTLAGFFIDTQDYAGRIVTNTVDFFSRGFKSIQGLELGLQSDDPVYAFVNYASNGSTLSQSVRKQFTNDGFVAPIIAGVDLQIGIEVDDYRTADLLIDYLTVKVKYVDKRFRRGSYGVSETT